jgi:hypothetical protein
MDVKNSENDDEETEDKTPEMETDKQNKTLPEKKDIDNLHDDVLTALYCSDAVHKHVY